MNDTEGLFLSAARSGEELRNMILAVEFETIRCDSSAGWGGVERCLSCLLIKLYRDGWGKRAEKNKIMTDSSIESSQDKHRRLKYRLSESASGSQSVVWRLFEKNVYKKTRL